jgi:START domain-containing protein
LFLSLSAQEVWKLKLDKEGIRIYTRTLGDTKIKSLKVICTIEAELSQMAAVLLDIGRQDEWFYHTKSTVLKRVSSSELYYYAELSFPVPFSNRDFIEHIRLKQDSVSKIVTMEVENVPNYIPLKHGLVRVMQSTCKWVVSPSGQNSIHVEFTLYADPAGSIPAWLINLFSVYGPFETFRNLRNQLKKPEYHNFRLPGIQD